MTFLDRWREVTDGAGLLAGQLVHASGRRLPLWLHPSGQVPIGARVDLPPESDREWGVEICPNPCAAPGDKSWRYWRSADVHVRWYFVVVDLDPAKEGEESLRSRCDRLLRATPEPWAIVSSGGGIHVWYALEDPALAAKVRDVQIALAACYGGDAQVARRPSLRMPGAWNPKRGRRAEIVRASWTTCSLADFATSVPKVWEWHERRTHGRVSREDVPTWVELALETTEARVIHVKPHKRDGQMRFIAVLDRCPACGKGGSTSHIYVDEADPRVICKRRRCAGVSSLQTLAARHGIRPDEADEQDEYRYRDLDREERFCTPVGKLYSAERREAEAKDIARAVQDADDHAQTIDQTQKIFVIESATGTGKNHAISRAVSRAASRVDVYSPSQDHAKKTAKEWNAGDIEHRIHVSPLYLIDKDGQGCLRPDDLTKATAGGWEAGRYCNRECPDADRCTVKSGVIQLTKGWRRVEHFTHRRLTHTRSAQSREPAIAWVDEHIPLVDVQRVKREDVERMLECPYVNREWKAIGTALLEEWGEHDMGATRWTPAWSPRRWRGLTLPENRRVERPKKPSYPRHVFRVLELVHEATRRGFDESIAGLVVWRHRDQLFTIERTFDRRLPKTTILSTATWFLWHDLLEAAGFRIERYGTHMQAERLTRVHMPNAFAVRGGRAGTAPKILRLDASMRKVGDRSWARYLRRAIAEAKTHVDCENPRVLVATYKAIADHGFGEGPEAFCREIGADAVDYYERLPGLNDYRHWEIMICFGEPNPGAGGTEAAFAALYGNLSESLMWRLSQQALEQACGRLRPLDCPHDQCIVAITPIRPAAWGDEPDVLELALPLANETCLDVWAFALQQLGCMSTRLAKYIYCAVHGLESYRMAGCTATPDAVRDIEAIRAYVEARDAWGAWRADGLPSDWLERIGQDVGIERTDGAERGRDAVLGRRHAATLKRARMLAVALSERDISDSANPRLWSERQRAGVARKGVKVLRMLQRSKTQ